MIFRNIFNFVSGEFSSSFVLIAMKLVAAFDFEITLLEGRVSMYYLFISMQDS